MISIVVTFVLEMCVSVAYGAEYVEQPDGTAVIVLTQQDVKDCNEGGSCMLITKKLMDKDTADMVTMLKLAKKCVKGPAI